MALAIFRAYSISNTAVLNALPRELASHGSAVNNTARQLSGAIGTAVIITNYSAHLVLDPTDKAGSFAAAASDTYLYMFILAIIAFIFVLFIPSIKKAK